MKPLTRWVPVLLTAVVLAGGMIYGPSITGRFAFAAEQGKQEAVLSRLAELSRHDQLSALFREVAKAVKPAVVEVHVTGWVRQTDPEELFRRFFDDDSPFRFRFEFPQPKTPERRVPRLGLGSGVIVDAENGYVLTNAHVVAGADKVQVVLADRREFKAEWIRTDAGTDLAVVRIDPDRLTAARLGDSDKMEVGDWVLAIGAPANLPQTVTAGIISAKGRTSVTRGSEDYENFLQTDAAINRGNSGGPLVNMRGEVVGINARIITTSGGGNEGIGLAVPSNMAKYVMEQLIESGKVVRGFLGVWIQDITERGARNLQIPTTQGALVSQVGKDSPAEKAGLRMDDFIVAVDGKPVSGSNELRNRIAAIAPGSKVKLDLYRKGGKMTVDVEIAEKSEKMLSGFGRATPGQATSQLFGLRVATLTKELSEKYRYEPSQKGVVIIRVEPGSDAEEQGLREGLLITHVQGDEITSVREFIKLASSEDVETGLRLRVRNPTGGQRIIFLIPEKAEK